MLFKTTIEHFIICRNYIPNHVFEISYWDEHNNPGFFQGVTSTEIRKGLGGSEATSTQTWISIQSDLLQFQADTSSSVTKVVRRVAGCSMDVQN